MLEHLLPVCLPGTYEQSRGKVVPPYPYPYLHPEEKEITVVLLLRTGAQ